MRKPHGFPIAIAIAAARNGHRHRGAKPEEPGRHERDFPQDHALEGEQRPGDDIGDHLRRKALA